MSSRRQRLEGWVYRHFPAVARRRYIRNCATLLGNERERIFLLSFDCDNPEDIPAIEGLRPLLKELAVTATLAVPGEILRRGRDTFRRLRDEGHEFLGHGERQHAAIRDGHYVSTLFYHQLDDGALAEDIAQGMNTCRNILGTPLRGFRIPHFGHSNHPRELDRCYRHLPTHGVEFSSSLMPIFAIRHGPLLRVAPGLWELPVSPSFERPLQVFDTFAFGFDHRQPGPRFADYAETFARLTGGEGPSPGTPEGENSHAASRERGMPILNLYCDPSQAMAMGKWWIETLYRAHDLGYRFLGLGEFLDRYRERAVAAEVGLVP
ncbi:MAG: hypothetical protein HQL57_01765 [Magnetococcales bacterium]|nr:hypothetical protein [Magnetococcales bacterium]MBF0155897.1 hypothetical protein [Magnetococcales bacterium]